MKYKTFRNLFVGGVVCLVVGGGAAILFGRDQANTAPPPEESAARPLPKAVSHVEFLLETLGTLASRDRIKDPLGGPHPKVNVYAEQGVWARAKVDLDRDEKWDEKWEFKNGKIERRVSPRDDEVYDDAVVVPQRAAGAAGARSATSPGAAPSDRSPDLDVVARLTAAQGLDDVAGVLAAGSSSKSSVADPRRDKIKDLFRGRGAKVNLYADDGRSYNRAKVDLDRDGKWDEKWTVIATGVLEKKVAPKDDEKYAETWLWSGANWQPKP